MKYVFNHQNYCNFGIYEENKLKGRSYFIPFRTKKAMDATDILTERYMSDMVEVLSGEWDFSYYGKISNLPKQFDTEHQEFDKVQVPSCWQYTGYEKPYYVNQRYQFKPAPPNIPKDIPVSIYRKIVNLTTVAPSEILTFLGACSNIELYVNGIYVGYSEGSHNTAEFQIAKYLLQGDNEIIVLVYKYCNGTYIECQDMFLSNGIFRDVYLTHGGDLTIFDYHATPVRTGVNQYNLQLCTKVIPSASSIKYTLKLGNKTISEVSAESDAEISMPVAEVQQWSAETPTLYTLYIELVDAKGKTIEYIREQIAFRHIEIKGEVFTFNDRNVKVLGVNHHDTTEQAGYVMTMAELERDVQLMKEFNVNTVRTSHYPPDPAFVKLCNKYGLYVVLEADIEAHGVGHAEYYHPNCISHNLKWKEHYWDRVKRAYERDKNCGCIIMWSLGNEAGGYACQDYCYNNLKKLSDLPIHYEGAIRTARWAYDVISTMYSSTQQCYNIAGRKDKRFLGKPFYMCEYAHAMGVGPGDLDYYVDSFYAADNMMGGCIWEWADHAVLHVNDNSPFKYTYGGDHEEEKHDSNFCVDGLFYPDRTPHTGAYCMKNCYRPIRATLADGNKFQLTNVQRFKDSSDINITWQYLDYGVVKASGTVKEVILPTMSEVVTLDIPKANGGDIFVIFTYTDKATGKEIAKEQVCLSESLGSACSPSRDVKVSDVQEGVNFAFDKGSAVFSKKDGTLLSYNYNGVEFINQSPLRKDGMSGFITTIYRAAIDNYMNHNRMWVRQNMDKTSLEFVGFELEDKRGVFKAQYNLLFGKKKALKTVIKYKVYGDGSIDIKTKLECKALFGIYDIPKFGLTLEMPKEFNNVEYYGMGEKENYSDFSKQSVMGVYTTKASEMREKYIKPQDSGNRTNVRWAKISNDNGSGLKFLAIEKALNFQATDIALDVLQNCKHQEDAVPMDTTVVCVDDFVRGIGSNSCGPGARSQYKIFMRKGKELKYKFRVTPFTK